MGKWVVTFVVNVDELREEHVDDDKIPDLPYAHLCDWLEKQQKEEFPRYATTRGVNDARDGKTFSMRIIDGKPEQARDQESILQGLAN